MFTKDIDEIITPDKLEFKFYCKTINSYSKNEISSSIDLATYKNNATLELIRNQTCFGSKSKLYFYKLKNNNWCFYFNSKDEYSFDASGNSLIMNPGSLKYYVNTSYEFTITCLYMDTIYSQVVSVNIDPAGSLPIVSLK